MFRFWDPPIFKIIGALPLFGMVRYQIVLEEVKRKYEIMTYKIGRERRREKKGSDPPDHPWVKGSRQTSIRGGCSSCTCHYNVVSFVTNLSILPPLNIV